MILLDGVSLTEVRVRNPAVTEKRDEARPVAEKVMDETVSVALAPVIWKTGVSRLLERGLAISFPFFSFSMTVLSANSVESVSSLKTPPDRRARVSVSGHVSLWVSESFHAA